MTTVRLPAKRKYRNQPTEVDGYKFASKREAKRYQELKILQQAGEIDHLIADKKGLRYELRVNSQLICIYEADFYYQQKFGSVVWDRVVEDCKGFKTPAYRIKKKLMKAIYGIEIHEV
jgi:Protein of unknown function (DUF1064)